MLDFEPPTRVHRKPMEWAPAPTVFRPEVSRAAIAARQQRRQPPARRRVPWSWIAVVGLAVAATSLAFALAPLLARAVAGPPRTLAHKSGSVDAAPSAGAEWGLGYAVEISPPTPEATPPDHAVDWDAAAHEVEGFVAARPAAPGTTSTGPARRAPERARQDEGATERPLIFEVDF